MSTPDSVDRRLLSLLQEDASLSYGDLGGRVGLSVSAVNERVKKLEARGLIEGYTVRLDARALGLTLSAFVQVALNDPLHEAAFLTAVRSSPAILECHNVTGAYAYLLKVRARDTAHLKVLLAEVVKGTPGITRTETVVVLETLKETAALDCGI